MPGCYLNPDIIKYIDKNQVFTIFELGSRDCFDAIKAHEFYNKKQLKIYAFECNPCSIGICKKNLAIYGSNDIILVENAVFDKNENIDFFPVEHTNLTQEPAERSLLENGGDLLLMSKDRYANIGASSVFLMNRNWQTKKYGYEDHHRQNKISVPAIRLDTFIENNNIPNIDLICMDLQGAELMALQGMGTYLKNVKYIITELIHHIMIDGISTPLYDGQCHEKDVIELLKDNGFEEQKINHRAHLYFEDHLFINTGILTTDIIRSWN